MSKYALALPDPNRLDRYRREPENGPSILFFGGGSALRGVSKHLIDYTHNSIHLLTPFDSGGSSAHLREAFRMLAVGDLRNRMIALADHSEGGRRRVVQLLTSRLPKDENQNSLRNRLDRVVEGRDPMIAAVADSRGAAIRTQLSHFLEAMPSTFDLRGASVGNLVITGSYLNGDRQIDEALSLFSDLVRTLGVVRPVVSSNLHLAAYLEDGETIVGQHHLTKRGEGKITSPVQRVFLIEDISNPEPVSSEIRPKIRNLLKKADAVVYPIGSFYTSLIASLLPSGLGEIIGNLEVPKVYVANRGNDPELHGKTLSRAVEELVQYLRDGTNSNVEVQDLVQYVIVDNSKGDYGSRELDAVRRLGIDVFDVPMGVSKSNDLLDAAQLAEVLASIV